MYNILVTGVGAIIGYGIIKSLRQCKFPVRIVGMDIYHDAVGQAWCDDFVQAVPAKSPGYSDFLSGLISEHSIDLVIPGIEHDISRIAADWTIFERSGAKFVINDFELLSIAENKWLTFLKLKHAGFPAIKSAIEGDFALLTQELGNPFLLKPRRSYASKGIRAIECAEDLAYWQWKLGAEFMAQEIVGDQESEYTVGVFGLGDGSISDRISFRRKLSGEGSTAKATVVDLPELNAAIDGLVELLRPIGPTNFQFRYHNREYLLLEVNPRISSSTSLRTAFGYNESEMCIEYYLENVVPAKRKLRFGSASRYIDEVVQYDCGGS